MSFGFLPKRQELSLALTLALWTGQRQGGLLRLAWSAYDGMKIRLKQSKTGARVVIPVGAPLRSALEAAKRRSPIVLVNSDGKPWTPDGFRSSWAKTAKKAGISGITFNDLRGTAVTRLALAECTEAEIATITGHSLGCAIHPRRTLPSPRSGACGKRNSQARKGNKNAQLSTQLALDVLLPKQEKLRKIKWLGN